MPKYFSYTLIILIFSWCFTFGQGDPVSQPQVSQSVYHDTSPPLRELVGTPVAESQWDDGIVPLLRNSPQYDDQYEYDPALQNFNGTNDDGFIIRNWDGVSAQSYAPPDPSGAVGPNHYMEMTNVRFQIWNKTGTSLLGPANLGTIWAGFPGPWASSLNDGDPIVLYDEAADRFMASQFSLPNYPSGPFYMLIAISQTGDPTGSWHRYGFTFSAMPDYPKFGVWPDGYYMSANSFSGNFIGAIAVAFERSQMLNGNAAQMVSFQRPSTTTWSLLPSDWNGTTTPPAGAPNYFGQIHDNARYGGTDGFDIYQFHVDWVTTGNSSFTGPTFLITSPFSGVSGIPQPSPGATLDDLSVMTMNRLDYRNFGSHQSMVVCHTINAGGGVAGMRWYEFRNTGASWSLFQQGTYSPDGTDRWMGSVAMNSNGDICLGYSASSTSVMPEIRFTGRFSGDPSGVMTIAEETIFSSSGVQTGLQRWGDYTQMSVDPAEPDVFWYVNQYQPSTGSFNWHTRIASIDFTIDPDDPTSFTATAISNTQIDVGFTPNASSNNVLIAWNLTGTFTEPSGLPPAVGQPFAGGTLLYNGTTSPVHHTGLNQLTTYYYKAFSYDNVDYSSGIEVNETTLANPILTDFAVEFLVFDNCSNSIPLTFGTAPGATDCYDEGLDQRAPPLPPSGVFDGRFISCSDAFFKDFRATNPDGVRIWDVKYQPTTGCEPVSFSWDPGQLPPDGSFHLIDPHTGGNWVNVNMRTTNNYSDLLDLGYLQIKYSYEVCANFDFADGWNMISLPLDVADANYQTLFPNASIGSLFGYLGGYFSTELVENCTGYWLKMPSEEIVEVCGTDREECVIGLELGWNMIGGPNCNVPLSSVSDPGGIIVPGSLFRYAGGYFSSTSIDATEGYWIKANAPGTITVSCGALVANNRNDLTIPLETLADFGRVDISDASNTGQTLYFNGKLDEAVSIESYSMPPVPPQGSFDARLTGDYRLSEVDEVTIQVQSSNYPLSVRVTDLNNEEGYELQKIVDGIEVGSHRIVDGVEIVISNKNVSLLKITKQEALPTSYALEQNYPNPFNPSTTIKFAVPKESMVNLSIYNVLGELVSTLVNKQKKPGYYEYDFNATDLASGIYLYRIKARDFVETKKMVLMK